MTIKFIYPHLFGGVYPKYPMVMIDESQDLSPLNHRTLELMVADRLIAVGDPRQAIYSFRGAHTKSMQEMKSRFNMQELTLSTSFRCPRAVVRKAQSHAPHMRWPEWAEEGRVERLEEWSAQTPPDGSAVICRNNAPLFKAAMFFIRHNRGIKIIGNDIGAGLVKLLKKMGDPKDSSETLAFSIENWRRRATQKGLEEPPRRNSRPR